MTRLYTNNNVLSVNVTSLGWEESDALGCARTVLWMAWQESFQGGLCDSQGLAYHRPSRLCHAVLGGGVGVALMVDSTWAVYTTP